MKIVRSFGAFVAMAALLAGCVVEAEPNNTVTQAQKNNSYAVHMGATITAAGQVTSADPTDAWRFNSDAGRLNLGVQAQAGKVLWVELKHCKGLSYADASAWPTCNGWTTVSATAVGSASSTTPVSYVFPTQTSQPLGVLVGCSIFVSNGCKSAYRGHEHDWWELSFSTMAGYTAGGGYGVSIGVS